MKTLLQLLSVGVGVSISCGLPSVVQAQIQPQTKGEDPDPPESPVILAAAVKDAAKPVAILPTSNLDARIPFDPGKIATTSILQTTSVLSRVQPLKVVPAIAVPVKVGQSTTPLPPSSPPATTTPKPPATSTPKPPATTTPAPAPTTPPSTTPAPASSSKLNCPPIDQSKLRRVSPQSADLLTKPLQVPVDPCAVRVAGTQPLTLQEALTIAERNNQEVQVARLQVEQSQFAVREARAGNLPTLGLQADISRAGDGFIDGSGTTSQGGQAGGFTRTTISTALNLTYDLYTSGLRGANLRAAERQSRGAELNLEATVEQLRLDTSTDYYNLQNADQQVAINAAAVANADANLRDAQAQERAGLGTRLDVLRAEVNRANALQQLINARSDQEVRQRQLSRRLSIPYARITASDPVVPAGDWTLSVEESIVLALKNRAELESFLVQRELSDAQIRSARAASGPTVSLSAGYQFQRSVLSNFPETRVSDGSQSSDGYTIALQARMNLFDGGATNARVRQRQKDREIAETRFSQTRSDVQFQVEQAYSTLEAQRANIAATEQAVRQAEEALRLAVLRFQAGVGTQTERINAEAELTRARSNRLSAIVNYNLALAQLRRAISNVAYR